MPSSFGGSFGVKKLGDSTRQAVEVGCRRDLRMGLSLGDGKRSGRHVGWKRGGLRLGEEMRAFLLPSSDDLLNQTNKQVGPNEWNCQLAQCRKRVPVGCNALIGLVAPASASDELRARPERRPLIVESKVGRRVSNLESRAITGRGLDAVDGAARPGSLRVNNY